MKPTLPASSGSIGSEVMTSQVSSDAAEALGLLAGQPVELNVTALRREEVAETPADAPTEELEAAVREVNRAARQGHMVAKAALGLHSFHDFVEGNFAVIVSGKRLLANLLPVATQISEETLAPLTAKERASFLRLLEKLA